MSSSRIIWSLFDHSGNWSRPYEEAGYIVRRFDLQDGHDARLIKLPDEQVHGILAAPPCTHFALSGARWWEGKGDAALLEGLATIDCVFRIVWACKPEWWAMENPTGRLSSFIGRPQFSFDPCDFGDPYTKRTHLWGEFAPPVAMLAPVGACEPTLGSKMHKMSSRDKNGRSETPMGFARAFYEANR